ncbi:restriction endonuclease subunit S [Paraclostridium sordellii]|uniref:restriction endonuclease subunit S n=1 Tax=Paraclostridium sordellii TaxID=1505 RepID=UPI0005DF3248|nr:restriction endonuclease subunit S [Paeniclostridium sordellii]CEQ15096.1 restriction endonuclease S subunit [[Clostridium] sordellii] [Paeniclostridium sordellii]
MKEGYKKTEVGVIPEEWDIKKLIDISEKIFVGIATSTTNYYTNEGTVLIRNQNIKSDKLDIQDLLKITDSFSEVNENKKLKYGDVLTVRTGYPGISCVVPKEFEGSQTFTTLITRPKKSHINPFYLSRYFNSELGKRIFNSGKAGGAQQNLGVKFLEDINVIIPPLKEQEKIAEILSTVDGQIDDTEMLIEKCQELKKGLMQKLLTRGIGHTEFKKTEVGEIPVDWRVKKLEQVTDIVNGGTPDTREETYWKNGNIKWATPTDITRNNKKYILETEKSITEEGLKNSSATLLPVGSILMSSRATIGERSINTVPMSTNQGFKSFICKSIINNEYLYYYIEKLKKQMIKISAGSTFLEISKKDIENIKIAIPSLEEQEKIAKMLSSIDNGIDYYKNKKEKLEELKKGLMQQLLTGKIRTSI